MTLVGLLDSAFGNGGITTFEYGVGPIDSAAIAIDPVAERIAVAGYSGETDSEGDDNQFHRVERSFGRFERMLTLPADADTENIGAELKNGVLEVTIPRNQEIESTRGRRIEIKS